MVGKLKTDISQDNLLDKLLLNFSEIQCAFLFFFLINLNKLLPQEVIYLGLYLNKYGNKWFLNIVPSFQICLFLVYSVNLWLGARAILSSLCCINYYNFIKPGNKRQP